MFNLILWLSVIWLPPLMYILLINETKFKKNLAIEVTLPYEAREDTQVLSILGWFKRWQRYIVIGLTLLGIVGALVPFGDYSLSLWGLWILLMIILPYIPYVKANHRLKALKLARGWKRHDFGTIQVNTETIDNSRWLSPWLFVPLTLLSLAPMLWERMLWPMYLTFGVMQLFFWFSYRYLYRNKSEMVDDNVQLTKVLTQVRRYNWGIVWLIMGSLFMVMSIVSSVTLEQPMVMLIGWLLATLIITIAAIGAEFRVRRVQEKLTQDSGQAWYVDEDDYWLGGVLYYNPNDDRLMINERVGLNTTFNLAKPAGKVISVLLVLVLLALPFTGFFISSLGKAEISLELTQTDLISHRGGKTMVIPLDTIQDVTLLPELPEKMIRTFGSALNNQLSGNFSAPEIGAMKLTLDPTQPPFLLVKSSEGTFLIASRNPQETQDIYDRLIKLIK